VPAAAATEAQQVAVQMVQPATAGSADHQALPDAAFRERQQVVGHAELAGQPGQAPERGVGLHGLVGQALDQAVRRKRVAGSQQLDVSIVQHLRRHLRRDHHQEVDRPLLLEQCPQAVEHLLPAFG
jgi:hypothetical protein